MAFLSKVGSILRQSLSKTVSSEASPAKLSAFQALRCMCSSMPSSKIFIGGLSYSTGENDLNEACSKYGQVVDVRVIMDRETGRSRGFGFVTFSSSEEASSAIQALDGQDLQGRRVRVNYATDKRAGGGGYGGGYGGGGYGGGSGYGGGGYGGGSGYSGGGYGGGGYSGGGGGGDYNSNHGGDGYGNAATTGGGYGGNVSGGAGGNDGFGSGFGGSENLSGGYDANAGSGFGGSNGSAAGGTDDSFGSNNNGDEQFDGGLKDDDTDFAKRA